MLNADKRVILLILAGICLLYFVIMIFPNSTGAKDANMLGVFNNDEYGQYPSLIHMLAPGATFYQSVRNFAVYSYYYYGYPFFFFSALTLLPLKLILGSNWLSHTQLIVTCLRQIINVVPMLIAIGFMVFCQTRFESRWRSILLFGILLFIPAVTSNSLWWHPDSLLILFAILTIFFLWRDNFRLGKNLIFAAIACGLCIGTKQPGFLLFLTIPTYIIWSGVGLHRSAGRIILKMLLFLGFMFAAAIISNPLWLLPIERGEIISLVTKGSQENLVGFYTTTPGQLIKWGSSAGIVTLFNGSLPFILLGLLLLVLGVFNKEKRLISVLILTWLVPFSLFFLFAESTMKSYYFLPVVIPLYSGLDLLFQKIPTLFLKETWAGSRKKLILNLSLVLASLVILVQFIGFGITNISLYRNTLQREQTSLSLKFNSQFQSAVLSKIPPDTPLKFYFDWKIYVPPGHPHWQYFHTFSLANYPYIEKIQADILLLEAENIHDFSDPALLVNSVNIETARERLAFYGDALNNRIAGYRLVYQDEFGSAYLKNAIADEYVP